MATTAMAGRWLLKTEPEEWSWEHQQANGGVSHWDGVRNALAQKHLRAMAKGDLCLFYHSGTKAKEIVGIARVCKTFYPDPSDLASKHGMVDIEAVSKLALPLPLSRLKQEDRLHSFIMFRQPRLSVVPVTLSEWELICELAGELEPPLSLDNGDASLKFCNDEARASSLSSDDNGNARVRVNKQELELSDGETRVSLASLNEEIKVSLPEENAGFRVRVSEQAAVSCNDETSVIIDKPSQPSTVHTRAKQKHRKVESFVDGSTVKAIGTTESLRSRGKAKVMDVEIALNSVAQNCLDERTSNKEGSSKVLEVSQATELAPDAKRVYSRRNRKAMQLVQEGTTPTCENLQFALKQESIPTSDKISDSRAVVYVADRVYKKRIRKEKLVESLLC